MLTADGRFHLARRLCLCALWIALSMGIEAPGAAQDPILVAFGDSITHGLGDGRVDCDGDPGGYPPRLQSSLRSRGTAIRFRTYGICGEKTMDGLTRLDDVLADNPNSDLILIMEGTNDLSVPSIGPECVQFNLNAMIDKALIAGLVPVVASPIPRAPEGGTNLKTRMLTELLQADSQARDFVFADPFLGMVDIPDLYEKFYSDPYHPNSAGYNILTGIMVDPVETALDNLQPEPCVKGDETLCLSSDRFKIEAEWTVGDESGKAMAVPSSSDTGFFWFFGPDNFELVVKVLDGREINGHYWVFYGGLSDVEYRLTVTDTEIRRQRIYTNPQGSQASVGDTEAFPETTDNSLKPSAISVSQ